MEANADDITEKKTKVLKEETRTNVNFACIFSFITTSSLSSCSVSFFFRFFSDTIGKMIKYLNIINLANEERKE